MKQPRFAALDAALVCMPCVLAFGQGYPAKPVRILVGFAPGGGTDIMARTVGAKISESLEQQFVIETPWRNTPRSRTLRKSEAIEKRALVSPPSPGSASRCHA